jgi:hypothetical protein
VRVVVVVVVVVVVASAGGYESVCQSWGGVVCERRGVVEGEDVYSQE